MNVIVFVCIGIILLIVSWILNRGTCKYCAKSKPDLNDSVNIDNKADRAMLVNYIPAYLYINLLFLINAFNLFELKEVMYQLPVASIAPMVLLLVLLVKITYFDIPKYNLFVFEAGKRLCLSFTGWLFGMAFSLLDSSAKTFDGQVVTACILSIPIAIISFISTNKHEFFWNREIYVDFYELKRIINRKKVEAILMPFAVISVYTYISMLLMTGGYDDPERIKYSICAILMINVLYMYADRLYARINIYILSSLSTFLLFVPSSFVSIFYVELMDWVSGRSVTNYSELFLGYGKPSVLISAILIIIINIIIEWILLFFGTRIGGVYSTESPYFWDNTAGEKEAEQYYNEWKNNTYTYTGTQSNGTSYSQQSYDADFEAYKNAKKQEYQRTTSDHSRQSSDEYSQQTNRTEYKANSYSEMFNKYFANYTNKKEYTKAYRRLSIKYHPDNNPGNKEAEEIFKALTEYYTSHVPVK